MKINSAERSDIFKHMLTHRCNRGCGYCITKHVITEELWSPDDVVPVYNQMALEGWQKIMLTGGEPTMARKYESRVELARQFFDKLFMTTQAAHVLTSEFHEEMYDAITFSIHSRKLSPSIMVDINIPVYASVIHFQASQELADALARQGFSGMTINVEQREGNKKALTEIFAPEGYPDFSIRVNVLGKCMQDCIVLPNLEVVNNYVPFLIGERRVEDGQPWTPYRWEK